MAHLFTSNLDVFSMLALHFALNGPPGKTLPQAAAQL